MYAASAVCTLKTLDTNSKQIFPENETAPPRSCSKIGGQILGIYINRSQIHVQNWEQGGAVSFLETHKSDLLCSVGMSAVRI
jgi:hypothetical protein